MTANEQLAALMETLTTLRDEHYPEIPDALIEEIILAHAEDPDGRSLHRRIQRALEATLNGGPNAAH
jgi:hypothetical protein